MFRVGNFTTRGNPGVVGYQSSNSNVPPAVPQPCFGRGHSERLQTENRCKDM